MRGCTVSAPVQSCNVQLLTSNNKYAAVQLLTKQTLYFIVEAKSRGKELYAQTCVHLSSQGMLDGDLFGLAIVSDGEYLFVDPDNKLSKYASKSWKSSNSHGLDSNNCPTLVFYFRVQFYVDTPLLLRDEVTRHHYYLQLRDNVLSRGLVHACSSREALYVLAGYALQADFGDYDPDQHKGGYFNPQDYFPAEIISSDVDLEKTVPALHRDNRGVAKAQAELQYIAEASSVEASPLTHNAHLYRLKHKKQDTGPGTVLLSICIKGIEIYEENSAKALTATFHWNNIGKLCFDRKKFEIRALNSMVSGDKFTYFTSSDEKSKHLFFLCRVTHQFSMAIQPRLSEVKRQEEEDRKRYRDCYMYSRSLGPGFPSLAKFTYVGRYKGHHSDQRISVISNTSSNTTSGIVSDRVQSLDESEDDLDLEIMINSPPAPSEESLALAHLRDLEDDQPRIREIYTDSLARKQSPRTTTATPATTDGSQCSSSCSTVVVASTVAVVGNSPTPRENDARLSNAQRRTSTSSSLELGYSHTAQNSVVSDTASTCPELDYSVQSAHTSSGIYTLRSSNTVESRDTNTRSSETSGVIAGSFTETSTDSLDHGTYSVTNMSDSIDHGSYSVANTSDSLECVSYPEPNNSASISSEGYGTNIQSVNASEMRERSGSCTGSIVSTSGSFRGDGSDPSDCGPRNLLSAEELSDLIVGNGSSEIASGIYPCRGTISSTMDSDSDYVSVPPPPLPPPRTDSDINYIMLQPTSTHDSPRIFAQQTGFHQNVQKMSLPQHQIPSPSDHFQSFPHKVLQQNQMLDSRSVPAYGTPSHVTLPLVSEEANARFVTTKPHINITTAQTTLVVTTAAKSYAAPTISYQTASIGQTPAPHMQGYSPGDARTHPPTHFKVHAGYPGLEPGANMKATHMMPIISKNNYLDVHASYLRAFSPPIPPPPALHARQPPPPPPTTVYTSQVTRGQIEQFRQQMYSDVDYVIYPMKDPAISKQEYMDAKQGSLIARAVHYPQAVPPPPYPYPTSENLMYRSTPNVATITTGYVPLSYSSRCASNQNLSTENYFPGYLSPGSHYSASTSPLYSAAASYSSSSTQSLRLEPLPHHQRRISPLAGVCGGFPRAKSDDNLLNSYEKPSLSGLLERSKYRRVPPPPPPPPYDRQSLEGTHSKLKSPIKKSAPSLSLLEPARKPLDNEKDGMLDIRTLREKSKNLDLPLISALCNDRSLLKQTKAFVMPRHPSGNKATGNERPLSWHVETPGKMLDTKSSSVDSVAPELIGKSLKSGTLSSLFPGSPKHLYGSGSSKLKYPVSGLSTTQMCKPQRRVSASTHTHPCQSPPNSKTTGHGGRSLSVTKHIDAIQP